MEKWHMYMEIYQMKQQGFKIRRIARSLRISRTTVYKYLEKSPEEMSEWMSSTRTRKRKLDQYELLIHTWISEHPDLSSAQIHDWLKERYQDLSIGASTVRSYIKDIREKYAIPKIASPRVYEALPESPMGAQVDFGEAKQKTIEGKCKKLYFFSMVLSHSRYKYAEWLDRPFTIEDVIKAHESAFAYLGGMPQEVVYDQDSLIVVSENGGDLVLTEAFQKYHQQRDFQLFVCRKADPESKGKIENTVKFIKQNFAKNRVFTNIDKWNEDCQSWLIRKDNTVLYASNRYSVPLGTYRKGKQVYVYATEEGTIQIRDKTDGPLLAEHQLCLRKGELIQASQHRRDRTKGINAYKKTVAQTFDDVDQAHLFLEEVHERYPRYIRDQLDIVMALTKRTESTISDKALKE